MYMSGIRIFRKVDVLVVGGGTAGAIAAIAAGREKNSTLVLEELGFLGGSQTGALVTPQMPNLIAHEPLNGGIDLEIQQRLASTRDADIWKDGNPGWFNPEALKFLLDDMAFEAGVSVLFFSSFEDVIMEGSKILGVLAHLKSGCQAILAERIIDATGDGDVAFKAGVPFESGDARTKQNQPFSVRFHLGGVDLDKFASFLESLGPCDVLRSTETEHVPLIHTAMVWGREWPLEPFFQKAVQDGILRQSDGNYFQVFTMPGRPGEVAFNCPRISENIDGTNPQHLSDAQRTGRQAIRRYTEFCRRYIPGFSRAYLALSAPMVGVRESRRILGEYYLTAEDVLTGKKFEDAIARSNYPIDIHRNPGEEGGQLTKLSPGSFYEIPYRCLIPKKLENLLVAGRCLSASFEAQASARIQSNCRAMGEAAGLAASLSLQEHISLRKLDGKKLRQELIFRGGRL